MGVRFPPPASDRRWPTTARRRADSGASPSQLPSASSSPSSGPNLKRFAPASTATRPVTHTAKASAPQGRMLVWQSRTLGRLRVEPRHRRARRIASGARAPRRPAARPRRRARSRTRAHRASARRRRLAVDAGAVLEAGEPRARARAPGNDARVWSSTLSGISRPSPGGQLVELRAGTQDRPLRRPDALGGLELDARAALAHAEHARLYEPVGERSRRARRLPRERRSRRRARRTAPRPPAARGRGAALRLLLATDEPRRHTGRLERRGTLADVRPADENPLPPKQPRIELALEPLPLSPRANRKPNEPLVVVPMSKHPRAPRRLPRPRSTGLEADALDAAPLERVGRRQPADPAADDGDLVLPWCPRATCIPAVLESHREGQ